MIEEKILEKIKTGASIVVTERIKEKDKERLSNFKGIVLARKGGKQNNATFTVRSVVGSVGVEKIYPINSPFIASVKIVSSPKKVGKSKLYWIRSASKKEQQQRIGVSI